MKRIVMFLLLSLILAVTALAQDKPKDDATKGEAKPEAKAGAPLPSVDAILDKFVVAMGGKDALQKLTSRTVKGSFEIEAMSVNGTFENFSKAPDKNATVIQVPNFGTINNVYDGAKGWSSDPMSGLRELGGAELAATKREADFYLPLNFKKNFQKLEVVGKEKVAGSEAYVVQVTPAEGGTEKFYFDAASGLIVKHDAERDNPQGKIPVELFFEDYKAVDGVKVAHTLKQVTPMFAMTIKFVEVKHNSEIEAKTFNKPAGN